MDPTIVFWLYIAAFLFGVVLFIAWVVLPFAIIGTKPLLRELIRETQRTNALLEAALPASAREVMHDKRLPNEPRYPPTDTAAGRAPGRFSGSPDLPPT